jgi:ELWxxDGT repeat protein
MGQGYELWRSNGTPTGTKMVKDIHPGFAEGVIIFGELNGKVLFTIDEPSLGLEPWISDGAPGGTVVLADITPGSSGTHFVPLFPVENGELFIFTRVAVADQSLQVPQLWRTDGTPAGTRLVRLLPEEIVQPLGLADGHLFFVPNHLKYGREPWAVLVPENCGFDVLIDDGKPGTSSTGSWSISRRAGILRPGLALEPRVFEHRPDVQVPDVAAGRILRRHGMAHGLLDAQQSGAPRGRARGRRDGVPRRSEHEGRCLEPPR